MKTTSKFAKDDHRGRMLFKQEFGDKYIYRDTPDEARTDLECTGNTQSHPTYQIEIKKRTYGIDFLSGSTMIEETKLIEFQRILETDPARKLIYFNFYLGGSWIAFDITNRLKHNLLPPAVDHPYPSTTSEVGEDRIKKVRYLEFTNNEMINDKMKLKPKRKWQR